MMSILEARWEMRRGSSPKPEKLDASVKGALLGLEGDFGRDFAVGASTLGLDVKREDITWPCGFEGGFMAAGFVAV